MNFNLESPENESVEQHYARLLPYLFPNDYPSLCLEAQRKALLTRQQELGDSIPRSRYVSLSTTKELYEMKRRSSKEFASNPSLASGSFSATESQAQADLADRISAELEKVESKIAARKQDHEDKWYCHETIMSLIGSFLPTVPLATSFLPLSVLCCKTACLELENRRSRPTVRRPDVQISFFDTVIAHYYPSEHSFFVHGSKVKPGNTVDGTMYGPLASTYFYNGVADEEASTNTATATQKDTNPQQQEKASKKKKKNRRHHSFLASQEQDCVVQSIHGEWLLRDSDALVLIAQNNEKENEHEDHTKEGEEEKEKNDDTEQKKSSEDNEEKEEDPNQEKSATPAAEKKKQKEKEEEVKLPLIYSGTFALSNGMNFTAEHLISAPKDRPFVMSLVHSAATKEKMEKAKSENKKKPEEDEQESGVEDQRENEQKQTEQEKEEEEEVLLGEVSVTFPPSFDHCGAAAGALSGLKQSSCSSSVVKGEFICEKAEEACEIVHVKGCCAVRKVRIDRMISVEKLLPSFSQPISLAVLIDAFQSPATALHNVSLNTKLSSLRTKLVESRGMIPENFGFRLYNNNNQPQPQQQQQQEVQNSERQSSSAAALSSICNNNFRIAPPEDEDILTVYDVLPRNNGQFLLWSLYKNGYERIPCGWPSPITVYQDRVFAVVLVPQVDYDEQAGSAQINNSALLGLSTSVEGSSSQGGAQRSRGGGGGGGRDIRITKVIKETSRDVLSSMQTYFFLLSSALDCCRQGETEPLCALLDGQGSQLLAASQAQKAETGGGGRKPSSAHIRGSISASSSSSSSYKPSISAWESGPFGLSLLHTAAEFGRKNIIELLVSRGASPFVRDSLGRTPLHVAAGKGFAECIAPLVDAVTSVEDRKKLLGAKDTQGRTALHACLYQHFSNTALWLIEKGADVLIPDESGVTPCDLACRELPTISDQCRSGNVTAVRLKLKVLMGVEPETQQEIGRGGEGSGPDVPPAFCPPRDLLLFNSFFGSTLFENLWSDQDSETDIYVELLRHYLTRGRLALPLFGRTSIGSKGTLVEDLTRSTALHEAVESQQQKIVSLLIQCSLVDINAQNASGDTALHRAVSIGDMDIVRTLLSSKKCNLFALNYNGETPLHAALRQKNYDCAKVLVALTEDPRYLRQRDAFGLSACHYIGTLPEEDLELGQEILSKSVMGLEERGLPENQGSEKFAPQPIRKRPPSKLQERFRNREGGRQTEADTKEEGEDLPTVLDIAIARRNLPAVDLIVSFMQRNIPKNRWPIEEFGSLQPRVLQRAFLCGCYEIFSLILLKSSASSSMLVPCDWKVTIQHALGRALKERGKEDDVEITLAEYMMLKAPTTFDSAWVDMVLDSEACRASFASRDHLILYYLIERAKELSSTKHTLGDLEAVQAAEIQMAGTHRQQQQQQQRVGRSRSPRLAANRHESSTSRAAQAGSSPHRSASRKAEDNQATSAQEVGTNQRDPSPQQQRPPRSSSAQNRRQKSRSRARGGNKSSLSSHYSAGSFVHGEAYRIGQLCTVLKTISLYLKRMMLHCKVLDEATTAPQHQQHKENDIKDGSEDRSTTSENKEGEERNKKEKPSATALFTQKVLEAGLSCTGFPAIFNVVRPYCTGVHAFSVPCLLEELLKLRTNFLFSSRNGGIPVEYFGKISSECKSLALLSVATEGSIVGKDESSNPTAAGATQGGGTISRQGARSRTSDDGAHHEATSDTRGNSPPPPPASAGNGGGGAGAISPLNVQKGSCELPYERLMQRKETHICSLLPFVEVENSGALLHRLCTLQYFVAANSFVNTVTKQGSTEDLRFPEGEKTRRMNALHLACSFNAAPLTSSLLRTAQFEPREESHELLHPIHYASRFGHLEVLTVLFAAGIPVNETSRFYLDRNNNTALGITALHLAAEGGSLDTVRSLVDHCAAVDARDNFSRTPLHYACKFGHEKVAVFLLEQGALLEREDNKKFTPLMLAAGHGHESLALRLLQSYKPNAEHLLLSFNTASKRTLAHFAAWYGQCSLLERIITADVAAQRSSKKARTSLQGEDTGPAFLKRRRSSVPNTPQSQSLQGGDGGEGINGIGGGAGLSSVYCGGFYSQTPAHTQSQLEGLLQQHADASCGSGKDSVAQALLEDQRTRKCATSATGVISESENEESLPPADAVTNESCDEDMMNNEYIEEGVGLQTPFLYPLKTPSTFAGIGKLCTALHGYERPPVNAPSAAASVTKPPLHILSHLFEAAQYTRQSSGDSEACRTITGVAQHLLNNSTLYRSNFQLDETFSVEHKTTVLKGEPSILDFADEQGWHPLHYAHANGKTAVLNLLKKYNLNLKPIEVWQSSSNKDKTDEKGAVDEENRPPSASATTAAAEDDQKGDTEKKETKNQQQQQKKYPRVQVDVPDAIARKTETVENTIYARPPPPLPPAPQWHDGYYACGPTSLKGCLEMKRGGGTDTEQQNNRKSRENQETKKKQASSFSSKTPMKKVLSFAPCWDTEGGSNALFESRILAMAVWLVPRGLVALLGQLLVHLPHIDLPLNKFGTTLLMVACYFDQVEVVKLLVEQGANVNHQVRLRQSRFRGGITPLILGAYSSSINTVDFLLANGADPNICDECGNTALHHAVCRRHFNLTKILLRGQASIDIANHAGDTPEDIAVLQRDTDNVRILRWWGATNAIIKHETRPPCKAAADFSQWIRDTEVYYHRLDTLHKSYCLLMNNAEEHSVPCLLYRKICSLRNTTPARAVLAQMRIYWWPEEVQELDLGGILLGVEGIRTVLYFIRVLPKLELLDLSGSKLTHESVLALREACLDHPSIRKISVANNKAVSKASGTKIVDLLNHNTSIVAFDVNDTAMQIPQQRMIERLAERNKKLQAMSYTEKSTVHTSKNRRRDQQQQQQQQASQKQEAGESGNAAGAGTEDTKKAVDADEL